MKIATWNCNGALRKKYLDLAQIDADILVIQECEDPTRCADEGYKEWAKNYFWIGDNKNRGMGVFAREHIALSRLAWDSDKLKYFIPVRVNDSFNLVAVWCHHANSPTFGYIGQLWKYMQLHKTALGDCVVAGDLNSNAIWDKWDRWWNHSDVVRELEELGIRSLYHEYYGLTQGKESHPTFYMQRKLTKPYHIDYLFASRNLFKLSHFEIGDVDDWLQLSDHMPVVANLSVDG